MRSVCEVCSDTWWLTWMLRCVFHQKSFARCERFGSLHRCWVCSHEKYWTSLCFRYLLHFSTVSHEVFQQAPVVCDALLLRLSLLHCNQVFRKESACSGLWVLCLVVCIVGLTLSLRTVRWLGMMNQSLMMKTPWESQTCFHWSSRPTVCQGKCFSRQLICNGRADTLRSKFIGSGNWWTASFVTCSRHLEPSRLFYQMFVNAEISLLSKHAWICESWFWFDFEHPWFVFGRRWQQLFKTDFMFFKQELRFVWRTFGFVCFEWRTGKFRRSGLISSCDSCVCSRKLEQLGQFASSYRADGRGRCEVNSFRPHQSGLDNWTAKRGPNWSYYAPWPCHWRSQRSHCGTCFSWTFRCYR